MSKTKYLILDNGEMESGITFPPWLLHKVVAKAIGGTVLGAGFIEIVEGRVVCSGESDSLGIASRGQADAELFIGLLP